MTNESKEFGIEQLRLCNRTRHACEVKNHPNTHLRGRPKKTKKSHSPNITVLSLTSGNLKPLSHLMNI